MASLPYKLFRWWNRSLIPFENDRQTTKLSKNYPPIFIIGAPRSGSTFLYQLLINVFGFSYLSNLHCWLYGAPGVAEHYLLPLYKLFNSSSRLAYRSNHGHTPGLLGPSECAEYWYRFFPCSENEISSRFKSKSAQTAFKNSIHHLENTASNTLLFKNLYNSFRIASIKKALPDALFIEIRRDPVDTGHSILKHRLQQTGRYQNWWSVPVPDMEQLFDKPPEEQVLEQIWQIYQHIRSAKAEWKGHHFHTIGYENLIGQSTSTLQRAGRFFNQNGVDCEPDFRYLPKQRKKTQKVEIDQNIYRALQLKSRDYNFDNL